MSAGRLVDKDGNDVKIGATLTSGQGDKYVLFGWRKPHKISSTGRVFVKPEGFDDSTFEQQFFPTVFGLKIVDFD